jgi:hypothetical protein
MNTKNLVAWLCLIAISLQVAGCGSARLNDAKFAEAAQATCQTMKNEITKLNDLDFSGKAEAYSRAVKALADININENSAPQGSLLRASLGDLAEEQTAFAVLLTKALADAGVNKPAMLMFTESGGVFASTGSIFNTTKVDIDPALVLALQTKQAAVKNAANALGLADCAAK